MSTLKVTNIQATGETATRAVSGVAAAWVNFNGTGTVAVRDSNNVSSLTDNGTGDYTVNFSNDFGNTNYCATGSHGDGSSNTIAQSFCFAGTTFFSAGSVRFATTYSSAAVNGRNDGLYVTTSIHGDLA